MAPKYILHYFPISARGTLIRMIFSEADVKFEENTIKRSEFPPIKQNDALFPLGQLPVLELENGEVICQSHAIARYLGNEFGLYGSSNHDKAIIDQTLDTLKIVQEQLLPTYFSYNLDAEGKKDKLKELFEDTIPKALKLMEKFLKKNNDGKSFLVGNTVSIGDLMIAATLESILLPYNEDYRSILDSYPIIKNLNDRVRNLPRIKQFLDKRGPPFYHYNS